MAETAQRPRQMAHYTPKEYRDSDKLNTHRSLQLTNSKSTADTPHYTPKEYTVTVTN